MKYDAIPEFNVSCVSYNNNNNNNNNNNINVAILIFAFQLGCFILWLLCNIAERWVSICGPRPQGVNVGYFKGSTNISFYWLNSTFGTGRLITTFQMLKFAAVLHSTWIHSRFYWARNRMSAFVVWTEPKSNNFFEYGAPPNEFSFRKHPHNLQCW
jgi:hypothetical protein